MKVAFVTRATLHDVYGGGAVHIFETARHLTDIGVDVKIHKTNEKIDYDKYDILHFFDLIRPANILYHIKKTTKPIIISPIYVDYTEYDKFHRKGISGFVFRLFPGKTEYLKTLLRWAIGRDTLQSKEFLWKGQSKSIKEVLKRAALLLPNSLSEYEYIKKKYSTNVPAVIVPNGVNQEIFRPDETIEKDPTLVICAARVEGVKNQLNLIRSLNNTEFKLILIGGYSPNQKNYYKGCKKIAAPNVEFTGLISQEQLVEYYKKAKVHILPSWFETCGLSTLEAAAMGCNIVITDKGFTKDYFCDSAFFCTPDDTASIYDAVARASKAEIKPGLQKKISEQYTWRQAAAATLKAYKIVIGNDSKMPIM